MSSFLFRSREEYSATELKIFISEESKGVDGTHPMQCLCVKQGFVSTFYLQGNALYIYSERQISGARKREALPNGVNTDRKSGMAWGLKVVAAQAYIFEFSFFTVIRMGQTSGRLNKLPPCLIAVTDFFLKH